MSPSKSYSASKDASLRICIHAASSGGMGVDIQILTKAFADLGHRVWVRGKPQNSLIVNKLPKVVTAIEVIRRRASRVLQRPLFHLNVHIETINEQHAHTAVVNVLMPHPEWFMPHNLVHLDSVDLFWGKSRDTAERLGHLGKAIRIVGFTSPDRGSAFPQEIPSNDLCLHIAGHSHVKGTFALVEAWKRHPDWPTLTIVGDLANGGEECSRIDFSSNNIRHIRSRIREDDLSQLRRDHAFHLQPSESEGFGHVVNEASSCGHVLVTTDAPPMNELIAPDCGLLVKPVDSVPLNFGRQYRLASDDLERTIADALALTREERRELGNRLRRGYLRRHELFMQSLRFALGEMFPSSVSTVGGEHV